MALMRRGIGMGGVWSGVDIAEESFGARRIAAWIVYDYQNQLLAVPERAEDRGLNL
jgi:hypothetical protein